MSRTLALAWGAGALALFLAGAMPLVGTLRETLLTLGTGALVAYAFWWTGFRVLCRLEAHRTYGSDPIERTAIELGLGILAFMLAALALGALGLFKPWAAIALVGVSLIGSHGPFLRDLAARRERLHAEPSSLILTIALFVAGVLTLIASLAPVTAQDALVYHLAIPAKYVEAGGLTRIEGSFFAAFPQNVEMLFTLGLLLRGESLAQWFHWLLGLCSVLAVAGLVRRVRPDGSRLLAAAVFGTIPTVTLIAGWAYVDLAVALFVVLSTTLLLRWQEDEDLQSLLLSALFAGAAAGCKYTGGFQGLLLAGGALWVGLRRKRTLATAIGHASMAAVVTGAVASPWWIRNIVQTGNPLFPFCHGIFGGEGWDSERARTLSLFLKQWGGDMGISGLLTLPWRLTFSAQFFSEANFDGMVGAAFLVAAPAVLWRVWKGPTAFRAAFCIALAHALFWAWTTQQVRFLLPALALFSSLIGATFDLAHAARPFWRPLRGALAAACAANVVIAALHFAHHNPLPVVLGLESKGQYLRREIPCGDYAVFEHIERALPESSYILFGSLGNPGFLSKRRYHSDAIFENRTLAEVLASSPTPEAVHANLRARGFTHVLFRIENVLDGTGQKSDLSLEEQKKLAEMLNHFARLECEAGGTYLYGI